MSSKRGRLSDKDKVTRSRSNGSIFCSVNALLHCNSACCTASKDTRSSLSKKEMRPFVSPEDMLFKLYGVTRSVRSERDVVGECAVDNEDACSSVNYYFKLFD